MPSSDVQRSAAARFLLAFVATAALALAALLATVVIVDPVGARSSPGLCGSGPKNVQSRIAKPMLAWQSRAATIVLGTSRVERGFDPAALDLLDPQPAINLGVNNGQPADFAALARDAVAAGTVRRAYIGLDFNSLHTPADGVTVSAIAAAPVPSLELLRRGYLSEAAIVGTVRSLGACARRYDARGALTGAAAAPVHLDAAERARLLAAMETEIHARDAQLARAGPRLAAARLEDLRQLLQFLREHGVAVVVFAAPLPETVLARYARTNLPSEMRPWLAAAAAIATREGARFVDLGTPAERAALRLPPCPDGGIACHFGDGIHYDPVVAQAIARRLHQVSSGAAR